MGGPSGWQEVLATLRREDSWLFDEDATLQRRPSDNDHHVLHKAKINLPDVLKQWLSENQDKDFAPRKQDVSAHKNSGKVSAEGEKIAVAEPFHVSLYSFRAQKRVSMTMLPSLACDLAESLGDVGDAKPKRTSSSA